MGHARDDVLVVTGPSRADTRLSAWFSEQTVKSDACAR
jgi:hypothetical protein